MEQDSTGRLDMLVVNLGERMLNHIGSNVGLQGLGEMVKPQIEAWVRNDLQVSSEPMNLALVSGILKVLGGATGVQQS